MADGGEVGEAVDGVGGDGGGGRSGVGEKGAHFVAQAGLDLRVLAEHADGE